MYIMLFFLSAVTVLSCSPVMNRSYLSESERSVFFDEIRKDPVLYQGKSYTMGGVIVRAKFIEAGSQIEAMEVPVDNYGYFEESGRSEGRFLAVLPKEYGLLDPEVYRQGRRVTLAGEFMETRKGRIDEMEYVYPVFRIKQIYLWPQEWRYAYPGYYYDPWFYPFPYYYQDPWWNYPYRHVPRLVRPIDRQRSAPSQAPVPEPRPGRTPEKGREREQR